MLSKLYGESCTGFTFFTAAIVVPAESRARDVLPGCFHADTLVDISGPTAFCFFVSFFVLFVYVSSLVPCSFCLCFFFVSL